MSKLVTIKRKKDFKALLKGEFCATSPGVIIAANLGKEEEEQPLFGFTVAKQHGNSVARNLLKRRLKAIIRDLLKSDLAIDGMHYVIIPKVGALDLPFAQLKKCVEQQLKEIRRKAITFKKRGNSL